EVDGNVVEDCAVKARATMGKHRTQPFRFELLEQRRLLDAVPVGEAYFSDAPLAGTVRTVAQIGGVTYFGVRTASAANLSSPAELWRTDGTPGGTAKIASLGFTSPFSPYSYPTPVSNLTDVSGRIFFSVGQGGSNAELWTNDGTSAGTSRLTDLGWPTQTSPTFTPKSYDLTAWNGKLYFMNYSSSWELWSSDGTYAN